MAMEAAKYRILGSDYIGVFCTTSDDIVLMGAGLTSNVKGKISSLLEARAVDVSISGSDLIGVFSRANSNGIVVSNLILDDELEALKKAEPGINVGVVNSDLNAIGSNILANDKIAIINPDYDGSAEKEIADVLGVEVIRSSTGGFKTVGANNILTNRGLAVSNRSTAKEKEDWDNITGFDSVLTTANGGGLYIGLAAVANSNGVAVGDSTTGYELARVVDALE